MNVFSKITNHSLFSKGVIFMDQALVSGSNFLLGVLLVRSIGLNDYGVYALLWMGVLFALGINQAFIIKPLLSIAPKMEKLEQEDYLKGLHAIQIVVGILFLILGFTLYLFSDLVFESHIASYLPVLSGIVFCQIIHDYYRKINFVKNNIQKVLILDSILYGGQLIGIFVLIFINEINLLSTLNIILGVNILSILVGMYKQAFSIFNYKDILVRHFHFSKWLLGTSILQWLSGNYFIIVGASILGTSAVGAIRMVQNIMGLCHILFLAMESIIPIEAAQRFQAEGENGLTQYLAKTTQKLGLGFCMILVGIALFSSPILTLIYGNEASQYSFIVFAYVLLYALVFLGHPLRFYLRTIEKTSPIFIAYVFGTIFSLSFAHLLMNHFEMYGLLFGLISTQLISLLTYYYFSLQTNRISLQNLK